jgi:hypothetical protein
MPRHLSKPLPQRFLLLEDGTAVGVFSSEASGNSALSDLRGEDERLMNNINQSMMNMYAPVMVIKPDGSHFKAIYHCGTEVRQETANAAAHFLEQLKMLLHFRNACCESEPCALNYPSDISSTISGHEANFGTKTSRMYLCHNLIRMYEGTAPSLIHWPSHVQGFRTSDCDSDLDKSMVMDSDGSITVHAFFGGEEDIDECLALQQQTSRCKRSKLTLSPTGHLVHVTHVLPFLTKGGDSTDKWEEKKATKLCAVSQYFRAARVPQQFQYPLSLARELHRRLQGKPTVDECSNNNNESAKEHEHYRPTLRSIGSNNDVRRDFEAEAMYEAQNCCPSYSAYNAAPDCTTGTKLDRQSGSVLVSEYLAFSRPTLYLSSCSATLEWTNEATYRVLRNSGHVRIEVSLHHAPRSHLFLIGDQFQLCTAVINDESSQKRLEEHVFHSLDCDRMFIPPQCDGDAGSLHLGGICRRATSLRDSVLAAIHASNDATKEKRSAVEKYTGYFAAFPQAPLETEHSSDQVFRSVSQHASLSSYDLGFASHLSPPLFMRPRPLHSQACIVASEQKKINDFLLSASLKTTRNRYAPNDTTDLDLKQCLVANLVEANQAMLRDLQGRIS